MVLCLRDKLDIIRKQRDKVAETSLKFMEGFKIFMQSIILISNDMRFFGIHYHLYEENTQNQEKFIFLPTQISRFKRYCRSFAP